ncbi:carbohydrate ABC transporter permease [Alkalicoccobacillus gibsonii]|uniref:carbohydrate ABC transporter permease n=1 Tax=Alkalicoccobacillus gibsonii TaxID=79881 RepID=UPI0019311F82|nr:sugar ABC transporter permease [Alkalicoccobacillus gibsonii]MBM0066900.1 sugar ABC transporter permease [Alkalicoccobacillus gibsonii]
MKLEPAVNSKVINKKKSPLRRKESIAGYLFTLPAILGLILWTIGPIIASLILSFTDYKVIASSISWIGFENYIRIFTEDLYFKQSVVVTFYFAFVSTFATLGAALFVALLMNLKVKGQSVWRTIYYLPVLVPAVASNILWMWLFNPEFGLLNSILRLFGLPTSMWIFDEVTVIPSLVLLSIWGCGGAALIFLAGLQDVPKDQMEAVDLDGGNVWHKFRYVTIPTLSPIIFFNLIMGLIGAFQTFNQAYIMTGGGPNNASLFYVYLIYREAFVNSNMGYASALAWILFLVISIFTLFIFKWGRSWVYYGGGR